jgi:hypothetical protein
MLNLPMKCNAKNFQRLKMVGRCGSVIWFTKLIFFLVLQNSQVYNSCYDAELKMGCWFW